MLRSLIIGLLFSQTVAYADPEILYDFPDSPNPEVTTGDLCDTTDPDFTEYRYQERIAYCQRNVEYELKKKIYEQYGVPEKCRKQYTIDHFIPLALGGSNAQENLWPEHKNVKATRHALEMHLYNKIKNGEIVQANAVRIIVQAKLHPGPVDPAPCE